MTDRPFSDYADRNGEPILEVLADELSAAESVLEIGSGTGQHGVRFAAAMPQIQWQTSDLDENHAGIAAWIRHSGLSNLRLPLSLDVRTAVSIDARYDGVYSANTAHIMSFDSVSRMFALVGTALRRGGIFLLYGPFRQRGEFNTASNATFHRSLRARDAAMGIRDLEALDALAASNGLSRKRLYAMPANNHIAVWERESQ